MEPTRSPLEALAGTVLGNYQVISLLGTGGMGVVYKARQKGLERLVALKVLTGRETEDVDRFFREARASAGLRHPNIVSVHDVASADGYHFFAMDLIEGRTLAQTLNAAPLPARRAAELVRTVARAVHYAHEHGVIHRDLKPANIMIDLRGEPLVMDFGLAKQVAATVPITVSGTLMGTPAYMAPEQAAGDTQHIDARTDVYALGAVLYEALTAQPPHTGTTAVEVLERVLRDDPQSPRRLVPGIDRDLETICLKALEKSPSRRYASAAALADDLERHLSGDPILATRAGMVRLARASVRRHPVLWAAIGVAVLCAAVATPLLVSAAQKARRKEQARTHLTRAREFIRTAMPDRALAEIDAALRLDPRSVEAVVLRGLARKVEGRMDEALGDFRLATQMDPEYADAWYLLFWSLCNIELRRLEVHMGCPEPARDREIREVYAETERRALSPHHAALVRALWKFRESFVEGLWGDVGPSGLRADPARLQALEHAIQEEVSAALEFDPLNVDAHFIRGVLRLYRALMRSVPDPGSYFEKALADADRALENEPRNRELLGMRAQILAHRGRGDDSRQIVARILEIAPDAWDSHVSAAIVFSILGDLAGAEAAFERAGRLGGDPRTIGLFRAMHHLSVFKNGMTQLATDADSLRAARSVLDGLLKDFPDHVPTLILRIWARANGGDPLGAMADLKRAEQLAPGNRVLKQVRQAVTKRGG